MGPWILKQNGVAGAVGGSEIMSFGKTTGKEVTLLEADKHPPECM